MLNHIENDAASRLLGTHDLPPTLFDYLTYRSTNTDTRRNQLVNVIRCNIQNKPTDKSRKHNDLMRAIAKDQNKDAFATLFSYFAPRAKSYLIRLGLDSDAADDIAQDVMVTVWKKAHLFDPEKGQLSTWIFRIARNRFIDIKRKRKFAEVDIADHAASIVADDETDTGIQHFQNQSAIAKAMQNLSPQQRHAIELSFFEDISHSQMAERLAIPLGTVKSRIRLAFNVLREALGDMK